MFRRITILLFILTPLFGWSQELKVSIDRYDTIHLKQFISKRVVVYKYKAVDFILDYDNVRRYTVTLTKRDYRSETAKTILAELEREISKGDTARLDQAYFLTLNWIPYDDFLCRQLDERNCLVRDKSESIHQTVIAASAKRKNLRYWVWGGVLYFLSGQKAWFIEKELWVS